ncbi:MAG: hypothetical protein Kow0077_32980 [Anaerolineae bacterium]
MPAKRLMILVIAGMLGLAACAPAATPAPPPPDLPAASTEYRTISVDELAGILASEPDAYTVLNVHIPYAGEIEGTDAHVPFNDLEALMAAIPDKDAPVVLYCRSGNMSEQASRALLAQGYTRVLDVPGGMNAWEASGRTLKR